MDEQDRVERFLATNDIEARPAYRLLDVTAEVGELAADANNSTQYGTCPAEFAVNEDELGDALFALLALAVEFDMDAGSALNHSIAKYEKRIEDSGAPGSDQEG